MDTKINLCDICLNRENFPTCLPDDKNDIKFGNGLGNDNIIKCANYINDKAIWV